MRRLFDGASLWFRIRRIFESFGPTTLKPGTTGDVEIRTTQLAGSIGYSAPGDQYPEGRSPATGYPSDRPNIVAPQNRNRDKASTAIGSGIHRSRVRSRRGTPSCLAIYTPGNRSRPDIPSCSPAHSSRNQGRRDTQSCWMIDMLRDRRKQAVRNWVLTHMLGVRSRRGMPGCRGIHSPENRSRGAVPSSLSFHSPAVRTADTPKQKVRRPGSRNRCWWGRRCKSAPKWDPTRI